MKVKWTPVNRFNPQKILVCDTETNGLLPWKGNQPFAVGMCDENGNTLYYEWPTDPCRRKVLPRRREWERVRDLMADPRTLKVFFNASFDRHMLRVMGIEVVGEVLDVYLMARISNTLELSYQLKVLSQKYLGIPREDQDLLKEEVHHWRRVVKGSQRRFEKGTDRETPHMGWCLSESPYEDYWLPRVCDPESRTCEKYCVQDVVRTYGLYLMYKEIISEDENLAGQWELEKRVYPYTWDMEILGVRVDKEINGRELLAARARAKHEKEVLSSLAGFSINPNSPIHLRKVLYEQRGLPVLKKTKPSKGNPDGVPSTDWRVLKELSYDNFVRQLLAYRSAMKAEGTFFGRYDRMMVPDPPEPVEVEFSDGGLAPVTPLPWEESLSSSSPSWFPGPTGFGEEECRRWAVHCTFDQAGARTLRFSSRDPNMQQVPDSSTSFRSFEPIQAREPFGPRAGYLLWKFDFSQQEARIFADLADIGEMKRSVYEGRDLNTEGTNRAWGGEGNPYALQAAAYALELGSPTLASGEIGDAIRGVWKQLGWNFKLAEKGVQSESARRATIPWLQEYEYDIVKAEKSIGKEASRGRFKMVLFLKIYGGGAASAVNLLYCDLNTAREFLRQFDEIFPGINTFSRKLIREARRTGYVINAYGAKIGVETGFAYKCVNYLIQSSAACMMKTALVRCGDWLKELRRRGIIDGRPIMTVHDELDFEIRSSHSYGWLLRGLAERMTDLTGSCLTLPMEVKASFCPRSWNEKMKIDIMGCRNGLPDEVLPFLGSSQGKRTGEARQVVRIPILPPSPPVLEREVLEVATGEGWRG